MSTIVGAPDTVTSPRRVAILILALVSLLDAIAETIVSPALSDIELRYHASPTSVAWLVTGYLIAGAVAIPVAGRAGDQFGRRRVLLVCLAGFGLGSLVCGLAHSITLLIIGRILAGLGGGGAGPLLLALARQHVPRRAVPAAVGAIVAIGGLGVVVGLLLVGPLVDHISVSSVFWLLLALAAVLALGVIAFVDESTERLRRRLDPLGAALLTAGLVCLMIAISRGGTWGWGSARTVVLFAVAAVAVALFWLRERTTALPLLDPVAIRNRAVWGANVAKAAIGFSLFIAFTLSPLIAGYPKLTGYGLGMSTGRIGLLLLPNTLAVMVGALAGARLITRTGARSQVVLGALLGVASYLALAVLHRDALTLELAPIPLGLGVGLCLGALADLVLLASGPTELGGTVAVNTLAENVASALGAQIAFAVLTAAGTDALHLPLKAGFTHGYLLGAVASAVAVGAVLAIPARREDPTTRA